MTVSHDCDSISEVAVSYVKGDLPAEESAAIRGHLGSCANCRQSLERFREIHTLLEYTTLETSPHAAIRESGAQSAATPGRLNGAPWWLVSLALHILIIALAGLVSMAIELPRNNDAVTMITELQSRPTTTPEPELNKPDASDALASRSISATDPKSNERSDVLVPPEMLANATLGDHFETIDPGQPDTHDARGNPDARMFHSVAGKVENAGGGGNGGVGMEDLIGVGGASSRGTGGGFGGGHGTGTGIDSGPGRGSFGQRSAGGRKLMVKKHGGSRATESAVDKALEWLAYHQEADGHWNSVKYKAGGKVDTGMTALALLAFLGAGNTERIGQYRDNVIRAVGWLRSIQDPATGSVYDKGDDFNGAALGYSEAMACMALSEAAGMARIPETRDAAQKAVNYCTEIHQQGDGSEKLGWRYRPKDPGDISNVGWFVMALKSAKVAGLHVNPASIEGAMKFLDSVELKNQGPDTGYGPASRYAYQPPDHVKSKHRNSAIGVLCRQFLGWDKEKMQSSVELYVADGGTPKYAKQWNTDLYYWYYGTLSTFQQGGDVWVKWNDDLKTALVPNQCKNGDDAGSWDPTGVYSEAWGRVGQTALSTLCLEVYYRYLQLAPDKK